MRNYDTATSYYNVVSPEVWYPHQRYGIPTGGMSSLPTVCYLHRKYVASNGSMLPPSAVCWIPRRYVAATGSVPPRPAVPEIHRLHNGLCGRCGPYSSAGVPPLTLGDIQRRLCTSKLKKMS